MYVVAWLHLVPIRHFCEGSIHLRLQKESDAADKTAANVGFWGQTGCADPICGVAGITQKQSSDNWSIRKVQESDIYLELIYLELVNSG